MIIKNEDRIIDTDNCSDIYVGCIDGRLNCIINDDPIILVSTTNKKANRKLLHDIYIAIASGVKYTEIIDGELIPFKSKLD